MSTRNAALDAWIVAQRPERSLVNAYRPYAFFHEVEPDARGIPTRTATVLLTNRECPWRCVMCDLWKHTTIESVPEGAIPAQIAYAIARLQPAPTIKLYNSGSFFDRRAIPIADYPAIAHAVERADRVIVESHPLLVGDACLRLRGMLRPRLEVAIGLETAHSETLLRLNKGFDLQDFARATHFLRKHAIDLRVFVLVHPPFLPAAEAREWVERSIAYAFAQGATAVSLLLTRGGNGAMEALARTGEFAPAHLRELEWALRFGLSLRLGRVFADTWDMPHGMACALCLNARVARLQRMNLEQTVLAPVPCTACGGV